MGAKQEIRFLRSFFDHMNRLMNIFMNRHFVCASLRLLLSVCCSGLIPISYTKASNSSQYYFEHLTNYHGLSSDVILDIVQDSKGFMWFCTEDGLNRYDGYGFRTFRKDYSNPNSLIDNDLKCMAEDSEGRLWIGTNNQGISIFDPSAESFSHLSVNQGDPRLPTNLIRALYIDESDNVWIGTDNYGLLRITPGGELIIYRILHSHMSSLVNIRTIYKDSNGLLWIGSWNNGLFYYEQENDDFVPVELPWSDKAAHMPVTAILDDREGRLWVGSWEHGLFILDGSVEKGFDIIRHPYIHDDYYTSGLKTYSGHIVFSIDQDRQGNIWVGTNNGAAVFRAGNIMDPFLIPADSQSRYAPRNSQISRIYTDREGLMWMGTRGSGVHKVNVNRHQFFKHTVPHSTSNIFEETAVFSLFEKCQDTLYVGIKSEGFYLFDIVSETFVPYREAPFYADLPIINTAYAFERDHFGRVWMGTRYNGVWIMDHKTESMVNMRQWFQGFNVRKVYTLMLDVDNNMWAGTDQGLYIFTPTDGPDGPAYDMLHYAHDPTDEQSISGNHITSIIQDSKGYFWIGTLNNGLNWFESTFPGRDMKFRRFHANETETAGLSSNRINAILEDHAGRIWIGTEGGGGLSYYDRVEKQFISFSSADKLIADHVVGMLQDNQRMIWLTTNRGMTKMDVTDIDNPRFVYFTTADGLQGNIFISGAVLKTSDARFYAGGYQGFNGFLPGSPLPEMAKAEVAVTDIKLGNESVRYCHDDNNPLVLTNKDKVLAVHFTLLSYKDSDNNRFAYKLEGFDHEWNYRDASNRQAVYTNLPRGRYTLKIRAANSNGFWSADERHIDILVKPALMASNLAVFIYFVVFSLIVYGLIRLAIYRTKVRQQLQLEKYEQMKLEQIHQLKMRSFANVSHELLTPLSILNCIIDNKLSKNGLTGDIAGTLKKNVNKLKRLIDQLMIMKKIDAGHMKLKVREADIRQFLYGIHKGFLPIAKKKNLQFAFYCDEDCIPGFFDHDKVEVIVQNLLSNAFKFTESGGILMQCSLKYRGNIRWVVITVQDTGCGICDKDIEEIFERFTRVNENQSLPGIGIGLDLVKSLTNIHKGYIEVKSHQDVGTKFIVEVPIEKRYYSTDEISAQPALDENVQPDSDGEPVVGDMSDYEEGTGDKTVPASPAYNTKTLLLVEDNDDLRKELHDFLSCHYHVDEAEDGVVAMEMAKYLSPDIIVSDVIMPRMDGFELCENIKTNFETSHIPVVLLTARTDDVSQTEGYASGADSYLTKPVNLQLLLARINGIVDAREGLKEFYRRRCIFAPELSEINIPPLDEKYIKRATMIIEENIENPEFNVQMLTTEMSTSNSMLYRKFNKLLGMTPNELIKNIRIKYSADLLAKGCYSVSEVAYSIGFNDLSYFGKCFKKTYGMSPSEYKEQNTET